MQQVNTSFQRILLAILAFWATVNTYGQVTCDPVFPSQDQQVTIYFHANEGNAALNNFSGPIYAHTGVITNLSTASSDWKHVQTNWGVADANGLMTLVSPNLWSKTFNIKTFYGIPANETVLKMAFVFRNTAGTTVGRTADGSDIFYDVYPNDGALRTKFITPGSASFLTTGGQNIAVNGASSANASLSILDNGTPIATMPSGQTLQTNITASAGYHLVQFIASTATDQDTATFSYLTPATLTPQDPPSGTDPGINYIDGQTVRLALYAPGKQNVFVTGDFNNWQPSTNYQMRKSLNGNLWWIEISGLTSGLTYRFQYLVDGTLKIADPLSTLVLDPWNDSYIPALTFPNIPAYPTGKTTGIVSLLQTAPASFNWTATNYQRPDKKKIVVYELIMRDFIARHDYQTLLDTLDYLQTLGVNAIELMPVNEFDGNNSWGYNPAFHKALDKYYGTPESFKLLVDECHQRGMAIILDVVFNQASGSSPLAQLYWDAANSRPAANNPWLNAIATHPYNVFNDFNHESTATKSYVKNCLKYWMEEFKIDGFRFDLSKGFTQVNSGTNVNTWSSYDASRIAIWKNYADFMWSIDPNVYVILEHFAANTEEKELADYGMMLWGNMYGAYKDIALGFASGISASLTNISYKQRLWNNPHLVGYMESHDEERIGYECKTYGNTASGYNVRSLPIAMQRIGMLQNLFYTVPGPKMLWEFGELGYDFSINWCENGTINPDCRTAPKPIRWDYRNDPYRARLHDITRSLLHLRNTLDAFETTQFQLNIGAGQTRSIFLNGTQSDVIVVANVGITSATATATFPNTGTWYEYYSGETLNVTTTGTTSIPLGAGQYRLYTSTFVALPDGVVTAVKEEPTDNIAGVAVTPNPGSGYFMLWFSLKKGAEVQYKLFDQLGRLIHAQTEGYLPEGDQQILIDGAAWKTGVYYLQIRTEDGAVVTRKVVKI